MRYEVEVPILLKATVRQLIEESKSGEIGQYIQVEREDQEGTF